MADQTGLKPFVLRRHEGSENIPYAPLTTAAQTIMPDGTPLADFTAARDPAHLLATIQHDLGGYPSVLLLAAHYTAGTGGAGDGPAGGAALTQYPCRVVYHTTNSLTVYTVGELAPLEVNKILNKLNNYVYTVTFDNAASDSVYIKLLLNMGNG